MSTVLLQQMESMLSMWQTIHDKGNELSADLQRLEMARSALALFASGAGVYRPMLQRLLDFIFSLLDRLVLEVRKDERLQRLPSDIAPSPAVAADEGVFDALRDKDMKMQLLVRDASSQRETLHETIKRLEAEKAHVESLLSHQMMRNQRSNVVEGDVKRLIKRAELEKTIEEITLTLKENNEEVATARQHLESMRELNAKYAAQALELGTRLHILAEHNRKISTALSMQQHDLMVAEKEWEESKAKLAELQRANQLLQEALEKRGDVDHREVFVARGMHMWVPKHLQAPEYVRHVPITKEMAVNLVFDLMAARKSKGNSLSAFAAAYLTHRFGSDATAYAYGLDLACKMFDSQISLQMFAAVSNNIISEEVYTIVRSDVKTFIDACASVDTQVHGSPSLAISFCHVIGILTTMFPGYSNGAIESLITAMDNALTNTGLLYYGTLFPDTVRDELIGVAETSRISVESQFSNVFKQLILDDVLLTMQKVEDRLLFNSTEVMSMSELVDRVRSLDVVGDKFEIPVMQLLEGLYDHATPIAVHNAVYSLRASLLLRSGLIPSSEHPHAVIIQKTTQDWLDLTGEALPNVSYNLILSASQRPEFFIGRRATVFIPR